MSTPHGRGRYNLLRVRTAKHPDRPLDEAVFNSTGFRDAGRGVTEYVSDPIRGFCRLV
jgi:hypothetical protein